MFLRSIMESCLIFFISSVAIGLYVLLSSVTNLNPLIIFILAITARISGLLAYKWLLSHTSEGQVLGEAYQLFEWANPVIFMAELLFVIPNDGNPPKTPFFLLWK